MLLSSSENLYKMYYLIGHKTSLNKLIKIKYFITVFCVQWNKIEIAREVTKSTKIHGDLIIYY